MIKPLLLFCFLLLNTLVSGQNLKWNGEISAGAVFSSEDSLPFWMHSNTSNRWAVQSSFSGLGELNLTYSLSDSSYLQAGSAIYFRDEAIKEVQRRDLYIQFNNQWVEAIVGSKQEEERAQGLSATNKNFLFSRNARPLAGLSLESPKPVQLYDFLSFEWAIAHYNLNDERYTKDVYVHHKRVALNFKLNNKSKISAAIQHYAQWGGTSPDFGDFPSDFRAFTKVFFASKGAETFDDDELQNAVGNHLGSYFINYSYQASFGSFDIYHEHPFEDGSGSRGINIPDGVYGIHFKPKDNKILKGLLYEFITTADQSGIDGGRGFDNYFNNNIYRSGWSYEGNIIGLPFILFDSDKEITIATSPVISNSLNLHHLGITGSLTNIDWKIMSSYVIQKGTLRNPFEPELKIWSNYGSLTYNFKKVGSIQLFGGFDTGPEIQDVVAAGIEYSYTF